MTRTRLGPAARRGPLAGAGIIAVVMAGAAVAWACTAHTGNIWFCPDAVGCSSTARQTQWSVGATAWVDGDGLKANRTMPVRYAPALVNATCMTGVEMATIQTNGQGDVITPQKVAMPSQPGDWKACAVTTSTENGQDVIISSEHSGFTTV